MVKYYIHVQCKHMDGHVVCLKCGIAVFPGYHAHHITSVHSNDATVRCVVKECGDSFGGFSELRQHVNTTLLTVLWGGVKSVLSFLYSTKGLLDMRNVGNWQGLV